MSGGALPGPVFVENGDAGGCGAPPNAAGALFGCTVGNAGWFALGKAGGGVLVPATLDPIGAFGYVLVLATFLSLVLVLLHPTSATLANRSTLKFRQGLDPMCLSPLIRE